ncbi:uncharacterized protein PODANS_1_3692 [Podospora anserina S mat+]|uniref:Podospora anserina S mat+ genomic DNA chromosome 1, supercontig 1 n=1 Tax=Podospora anserina (strain S / ATCC MYA-4624 / DSM 980 / FGSC 10383) TaxID=515849 RepID=B2AAD9_PODAN|nr:uncharacterized protein PODANS_1_3692 [Podospora anserina S mat+]CAP60051.1 unnamed protein product [Podospora anserina S mat+]CDP22692.1 Putative protein of unknown function [Podospora anserina S mat+]
MRFAGCYGDNPRTALFPWYKALGDLIIPVPSIACDERDVPIRSMEHEGDHAFKPRAGAGRFAQKHDTPWAGSWTEAAKNASEAIKTGNRNSDDKILTDAWLESIVDLNPADHEADTDDRNFIKASLESVVGLRPADYEAQNDDNAFDRFVFSYSHTAQLLS